MARQAPTIVASSPIARCRKPPTFAFAYICPARSSKRRMRIIWRSQSRAASASGSSCLPFFLDSARVAISSSRTVPRGERRYALPARPRLRDVRRDRIRPHDDRVGDRHDLVGGHPDAGRVGADRLRAARLVDADRAERAVLLVEDVRADPADVGRHLLVADLLRARRSLLELLQGLPGVAAADRVELHGGTSWSCRQEGACTGGV